jgi:general secretion pathway protein A
MYEKFFGLKEAAFNLTPDPSFLYLNSRSKEALNLILYAIERREGFIAVVGDVGTGKTTLCWALLERLARKNVRTALIQNPMLSEIDILKSILQDLGVSRDEASADSVEKYETVQDVFNSDWMQGMTKKQLLDKLNRFLAARAEEDVFTVLIVDEAQNIPTTLLEQLRLLSNLETAKKKLLQIIFVGQLELDQKLKSSALRQLNQRISVRFETKALSKIDTEHYIRRRLAVAGVSSRLQFGTGAFRAIWNHSKGYPRLINLICDRALLAGYTERSLIISRKLVRKAVASLNGKEIRTTRRSAEWNWVKKISPYFGVALILLSTLFLLLGFGLIKLL